MSNAVTTEDNKLEYRIQIDRIEYTVHKREMTGEELRKVPVPPIGSEFELWEVVPGHDDKKIKDHELVEIRDGKRFFTAPAHINPGSNRV